MSEAAPPPPRHYDIQNYPLKFPEMPHRGVVLPSSRPLAVTFLARGHLPPPASTLSHYLHLEDHGPD